MKNLTFKTVMRLGTPFCLILFFIGIASSQEIPSQLQQKISQHEAIKSALAPQIKKINSTIYDVVQKMEIAGITRKNVQQQNVNSAFSTPLLTIDRQGRLQVTLRVTGINPKLIARLIELEFEIESSTENLNITDNHQMISGWVPFYRITDIAGLAPVFHIRPTEKPITHKGEVLTEGDAILSADRARNTFSVDGSGQKVGVISDGCDHIGNSQASGDLPLRLNVVNNRRGGDEGTAMLEIVHDLAPGAELSFADAGFGEADFANNIIQLKNIGCTIITDDISYFTEPVFEDGVIAQTVDDVVNNYNIVYTSSAGNQHKDHYRGDFYDTNNNGYHNFSANDETMTVELASNATISAVLQWNNQFGKSSDDYDLYIYDEQLNNILASGENTQNGYGDPIEIASYKNTNSVTMKIQIAVKKFSGQNRCLSLYTFGVFGVTPLQYVDLDRNIYGHAGARYCLAVAAIGASDPGNDDIEPFSSQGPTRIYTYDSNGNPISFVDRNKPEHSAIDAVQTKTGQLGFFSNPFYGTSAATPHTAGVAALVREAAPTLNAIEVGNALNNTAIDLGNTGFDYVFGHGRIDAFAAVQSVLGGNDLKPPRNLTASVAGNNVTLNWEPPESGGETQEVELKFDDNSFEGALGFSNGTGTVANGPFVPSAYPATLKTAKFVTNGARTGDNVNIRIYVDASGTAAAPSGSLLAGTVGPVPIGPGNTFQEVDLSTAGITLATGAKFFIGVEQINTENFGVRLDQNAADGHAFYCVAQGSFYPITQANFHGAFGIRAVIEIPAASLAAGAGYQVELPPINFKEPESHLADNVLVTAPVKVKYARPFIAKMVEKELPAIASFLNNASLQSYNIYRSTTAPVQIVSQNKIGNVTVNSTSYNDINLPGGFTYYYVVTAVYVEGESDPSNQVSAQIVGGSTITWQSALTVKDAGNETGTLTFGQGPNATDDLDSGYGEEELPPTPPTGVFDARFELPVTPAKSSVKDFRNDASQSVTWRIKFQPGSVGFPITFSWNNTTLPSGSFSLKDEIIGTLVNVNMRAQNSYTLTNPGITSLKIDYSQQTCKDVVVNNGWNLVSVPVTASDLTVKTIFPDATSSAFGYDNGYVTATTLTNGKGYWLKFSGAHTYSICGSVVTSKEITVKAGWNIIGPFETDVQVAAITSNPAGIIASNFFGYNNGYTTASTLIAGKGYWVKTKQAGSIIIPSAQMLGKIAEQVPVTGRSTMESCWPKLVFTDANGNQATLFLARDSGTEQFELPPVPPDGIYDVRFGSNRYAEKVDETGQQIRINSAKYPVRIKIENADAGMILKFSDLIDGEILNETLTPGKEIVITGSLQQIAVECGHLPAQFELLQNYPNPFNPATEISFSVPEESHVRITIYNTLGQKMMELINQKMSAGYHKVQFNAQNFASGVYYYRMESKNFVAGKKMIILK